MGVVPEKPRYEGPPSCIVVNADNIIIIADHASIEAEESMMNEAVDIPTHCPSVDSLFAATFNIGGLALSSIRKRTVFVLRPPAPSWREENAQKLVL